MEQISMQTMANGVRVVVVERPGASLAHVVAHLDVGARDERKGEEGMAHFAEHMLFAGTRTRTRADLELAFDDLGAVYNAGTDHEATLVDASVLVKDAGAAIGLLAEMALRSEYSDDDVERERGVIAREIAERGGCLLQRLRGVAYADHRRGGAIPGTPEAVAAITARGLRRFERRTQRPGGLVIGVCGDVDARVVHEQTAAHLAHRARTAHGRAAATAAAPVYRGGDDRSGLDRRDPGHVAIAFPGCPRGTPGHIALDLLVEVMAGGPGSRLYGELRAKRALVYEVDAFTDAGVDAGLFVLHLKGSGRSLADAARISLDAIAEAALGVGEDELRRAKSRLAMRLARDMDDGGTRVRTACSDVLRTGRAETLAEKRAGIGAVDRDAFAGTVSAMIGHAPCVVVAGDASKVPDSAAASSHLR